MVREAFEELARGLRRRARACDDLTKRGGSTGRCARLGGKSEAYSHCAQLVEEELRLRGEGGVMGGLEEAARGMRRRSRDCDRLMGEAGSEGRSARLSGKSDAYRHCAELVEEELGLRGESSVKGWEAADEWSAVLGPDWDVEFIAEADLIRCTHVKGARFQVAWDVVPVVGEGE
jgi:hypothetical protein